MSFTKINNNFIEGLPKLTGSAVKVFLYLSKCRDNKTGLCFPSQEKLMEGTGLSRNSIKAGILKLVEFNYVTIKSESEYSKNMVFEISNCQKLTELSKIDGNRLNFNRQKLTESSKIDQNCQKLTPACQKLTIHYNKVLTRPILTRLNNYTNIFAASEKSRNEKKENQSEKKNGSCNSENRKSARGSISGDRKLKKQGSAAVCSPDVSHAISGDSRKNNKQASKLQEAWDEFWEIYPRRNGRKVGKKAAKAKFFKIAQKDVLSVLMAVRYYAAFENKNGYAKDAERFLRNDYWKGWIDSPEEEKENLSEIEKENLKFEEEMKGQKNDI